MAKVRNGAGSVLRSPSPVHPILGGFPSFSLDATVSNLVDSPGTIEVLIPGGHANRPPVRKGFSTMGHAEATPRATPKTGTLWWITLAIFVPLYGLTCQRGVDWGDSGSFQLRVQQGDYVGPNRLALAHPLYILLGRTAAAIPIGDVNARISFLSGLGMALALANLSVVAAMITGNRLVALLIAAMLGTAQTPWLLSTMAEVYTWTVAGLTAELYLLFRLVRTPRWQTLAALALVSGLGLSNHNLALLPLPAYGVLALILVCRRRLHPAALAVATLAYVLGAGPYLYLIAREAMQTNSMGGAIHGALFGNFQHAVLSVGFHPQYFKWNLCFLGMNFISVLAPLAIVGVMCLRRLGTTLALSIGYITAVHVVFLIRYPRPDMFTFSLPSLTMLAVLAALGAAVLMEKSPLLRRLTIAGLLLSILVQPVAYAAAPRLARAVGVDASRIRRLPFRDDLRYWLVPWKHNEHSAEQFAAAALRQAAPDGIILSDGTPLSPLLLLQGENEPFRGVSPVDSFDPELKSFLRAHGERPIYLVAPGPTYTPAWLLAEAEIIPEGVLYRVRFPGGVPSAD